MIDGVQTLTDILHVLETLPDDEARLRVMAAAAILLGEYDIGLQLADAATKSREKKP